MQKTCPSTERSCPAEHVVYGHYRDEFGEDFTVGINRHSKTGVLRGSDIGEDIRIVDNTVRGGLILGESEYEWLRDAWLAGTGEELLPTCCPARLFKELFSMMAQGTDAGLKL